MTPIKWDGKTITKPGFYSEVPIDWYHSQEICNGPSVSSSGLRKILAVNKGSPAHFYDTWSGNPHAAEVEDKPHFVLGRALHHLLLFQPSFGSIFVAQPDELPKLERNKDGALVETGELRKWHGNNLEVKEFVKEITKQEKSILKPEDVDSIKGMVASLNRSALISSNHVILTGHMEVSGFWKDEETGLWIKIRPDGMHDEGADYSDLKTTLSVIDSDLRNTVSNYAYHQQGALVGEGAQKLLGIQMNTFSLVFVEKKRPFCVSIVAVKDEALAIGHQQNHDAMRLVARCLRDKRWPGPNDDEIKEIGLVDRYRDAATAAILKGQQE